MGGESLSFSGRASVSRSDARGMHSQTHLHPLLPPHPRRLAGIGFGIGLAMSWLTFHFLHWLRWRGAKPYVEMSVMIAVAYLSFFVANKPAGVRIFLG